MAAAALLLLASQAGAAQPADAEPPLTVAAVEKARRQIAADLADLTELPETAPGVEERRRLLERIDRYLVQQLDALDRARELTDEAADADAVAERNPLDGLEPPFDLATYDAAADRADRAALLVRRLERAEADAREALAAAREALDQAEQRRRAAKDAATRPQADAAAPATLQVRELESRLAAAEVRLRTLELRNASRALETNAATATRLRAVRDAMADRIVLRPEDHQERVAVLATERAAIRDRMQEVRAAIETVAARLHSAESAHARGDAAGAAAQVAAARAERSALQRELSVLAERLERIDQLERWIDRRFAVLGGDVARSELARWYDETRAELESLDREEGLKLAELAEVERERDRVTDDTTAPGGRGHDRQVAALTRLAALYRQDLEHLGATRDRGRRLQEDLADRVDTWTVRERLAAVASAVAATWSYEITSSDDRPITVGKVVLAVLVFGLGYLVARFVSLAFGRRALPRLGFDPGAAQAYESLGFYALLAIAFLVALRMVNIPLTAFAVVGGALAIGVGFGSQNVVSNFISGLILLAERPIKIGDLVELEGTYGNVERIGLRSTRVRTGENVHVIVPNAMFLENRVINWTHNDPQVRVKLGVGVVYGSPTRDVERIIREVLDEHDRVLKQPDPKVLFTEFGDNSLNFEAHFWMRMRVYMDRREVESQLRYRIDDRFREAGIVIAFPQRDVHLDTVAPLAVRVVRGEPSESGS